MPFPTLHTRHLTEQEIRTLTASLDLTLAMLERDGAEDHDLIAACALKYRLLGDLIAELVR
jgi:hypothetical protein